RTRVDLWSLSDHKSTRRSLTVGRYARKRGLPAVSVTRCAFRDGSVSLPCPSRDEPVALAWAIPATPHIPGRLGHGHSQPGPWPRRHSRRDALRPLCSGRSLQYVISSRYAHINL